ncbi:MAG TPA: MBL fold metallo-hydrolase [Thermoanaerobaculia bacterium]|nr:MBL fold metallo-hydrolase [Thermoanaerobaculia bacterium]
MLIAPLGSGSAGNAHYVESDGTGILVDCGFGIRETTRRLGLLGRSVDAVHALVISHEHTDHIRGAESVARKLGVPVFMTRGTLDASRLDASALPVRVFENNRSFRVREIEVHTRRTLHDANDPSCFVLEARDGARVGVASDLGHVDAPVIAHLSGCDALLFEANHDLDMLRSGSYPWSLKRRILSRLGHLSNDDAMAALQRLLGAETRELCLIHLSRKNNHESIVHGMASDLLRRLGTTIGLHISRQDEPGRWLEVHRVPLPRAVGKQYLLF